MPIHWTEESQPEQEGDGVKDNYHEQLRDAQAERDILSQQMVDGDHSRAT